MSWILSYVVIPSDSLKYRTNLMQTPFRMRNVEDHEAGTKEEVPGNQGEKENHILAID